MLKCCYSFTVLIARIVILLVVTNLFLNVGAKIDKEIGMQDEKLSIDSNFRVVYCFVIFHSISDKRLLNRTKYSVESSFLSALKNNFKDLELISSVANIFPVLSKDFANIRNWENGRELYRSAVCVNFLLSLVSGSTLRQNEDTKHALLSYSDEIGENLIYSKPISIQPSVEMEMYLLTIQSLNLDPFFNNLFIKEQVDQILKILERKLIKNWKQFLIYTDYPLDVAKVAMYPPQALFYYNFTSNITNETDKVQNIKDNKSIVSKESKEKNQVESHERHRPNKIHPRNLISNSLHNSHSFYYSQIPVRITFTNYAPREVYKTFTEIIENKICQSSESLLSTFLQDILLNSTNTSTMSISLRYVENHYAITDEEVGKKTNEKNNRDTDNRIDDDDFVYYTGYNNTQALRDMLQCVIVVIGLIVGMICLIHIEKCRSRLDLQKVVPFDGSIPQDI